jgi:hypothetical protein
MAMSLLDGLKIVAYVINILCNGQTTITRKLLFTGLFLCQPLQDLFCRLVRWEHWIPDFDNLTLHNGKSNPLRELFALPINRRQTQSLDKVQVFITQQFKGQMQPRLDLLLVRGGLRAQAKDLVYTCSHELSLCVSE